MSAENEKYGETGLEIAVIGMAGRFPGAKNLTEFWENLRAGKESVTFLRMKSWRKQGLPRKCSGIPSMSKQSLS